MGNCQAQSNSLLVNASTWNQDTHGLFDYESKQIAKQEFQIHQSTYFMRDPENMDRLISQATQPQMTLFQIDVVGNQRCIRVGNVMPKWGETAEMSVQHPQQKTPNKKCWLSVHSVGRVPLKRGDIFRLGRLTFRIWDMDISSMDQNDSATSEGGVDVCRVCLRGPMPNNPLLNPCKCCGSLKYLHKECLKRWLQSKMPSKQTVSSELYLWKDLQCEICKTFYKPIFQSDGTSYHFSELAKPMSSYMILEFKSKKSEQGCGLGDHFSAKADGIYVVYLNDEVRIGRARNNEIRACDVSVSRCHATIKCEGQQLYLQDNDSKYGTLLLLNEDMPILGEHNNVELQVGRSVFKLVALIQNLVHSKKADTLLGVITSLQEAAAKGSQVCILGETFNSPYTKPLLEANAEDFSNEKDRETYDMMCSTSEKLGLCIIGTIPEKQDGKYYNSALCFNKGKLLGTYRKTHLFDIDIPGQITYFESKTFTPGQDLCVIDTEYGRFGLGICYDIRFPEFAQCMRNKGCQFLIYPGAFNQTTGPLHWELLMRARAVDYQVYLAGVSTARYQGDDPSIYQAWGHSTLVDPMGRILNTCEQQPAVLVSDIDLTLLESVRQQIPVSKQRRNDIYEILCKK